MASMNSAFAASNYIFCQSGLLMMMRRSCPTAASTERPAAPSAGGALAGAQWAHFDEKVQKPQSKFYGRIGANTYLMNLNTFISASQLFGV